MMKQENETKKKLMRKYYATLQKMLNENSL